MASASDSRGLFASTSGLRALAALWKTSIGKKAVMAVTGVLLAVFVLLHMIGNLKVYTGADHFDAYARGLRAFGGPFLGSEQALWGARLALLTCFGLHVMAAVQLTQMSRAARPIGYTKKRHVATTLAARSMRWGGVAILIFLVVHLLHFTWGVIGFEPGQFQAGAVYRNVVNGFRVWPISLFYILAQVPLGFHLVHGAWSSFQTMGMNARRNSLYRGVARILAIAVVAGNISIPLAVLAGFVR